MERTPGHLRIGELSRRVGVSRELLRAWERRYGLLQPTRSSGDFRLYSDADEERARSMRRFLAGGLSAAQAAEAVRSSAHAKDSTDTDLSEARIALQAALEHFDDAPVHPLLDGLLATFGVGTVLGEVILPVLSSLGDRWCAGEVTVAQEHFASNVLRGRLLGLARGWGRGSGPIALLACPPHEQHDMGLVVFGIALREAGWRVTFLGADTPMTAIESTLSSLDASVVVLSTVNPERLHDEEREIAKLTRGPAIVAIGGAGANSALADRLGATLLQTHPISAANALAHSALP